MIRMLLCAALALAPAARAADEGTMTATFVEGSVTAAAGPVLEGDLLHKGDTLVTAPGARVEITFSNGSTLRVGESTKLTLGGDDPAGARFSARLFFGNVWAKVRKLVAQNDLFEVETDNAVAGVRGTEFRVASGGGGQEDLVRVYEGAVEVKDRGNAWTHRVLPDQELRFSRERKPEGPRKFDAAAEHHDRFASWARTKERPMREHQREKRERRRH